MANTKKKKSAKRQRLISEVVKPSNMDVIEWQVALRQQKASQEHYQIRAIDDSLQPGNYEVKNGITRQSYKVVFRGDDSEWNYCSCLDFKTSRLGTCKHLEATREWLKGNRRHKVHTELPTYTSVYLSYRGEREVRIRIGSESMEEFEALAGCYFDAKGALREDAYERFPQFLNEAKHISDSFRCYDDALDFVLEHREATMRQRLSDATTDIQLDELLRVRLFPYQKEGVRFAFAKGRALIADEMGLGKTVQAIATAEMLRKHHFADSVLIVCPTSLKYQWKSEIERFTGAEVLLIEGNCAKRSKLYAEPTAYKIVSYHSMANDVKIMGHASTDVLILDEVQRLKNWNTIIATAARRIESRYVVALSGTPLENKLEEFYSVMELVDQFCLGPYYEFRQRYIELDDTSKVIGYKKLNEISAIASRRLIRRRKVDVEMQLPERQDTNLLVAMTQKQMDMHNEYKDTVAMLIRKWNRQKFLTEKDRNILLRSLNMMRMVCDSTFIVDQTMRDDVKIDEATNILSDMLQIEGRKAVVFSQWERMARLLVQEMGKRGVKCEFLHGGVPSPKRGAMMQRFRDDADCRVFVSTDAGSTGLNLQSASLIINLDLPWNPAVLEQRIGRIYRLGQRSNVQIINLVSKGTIEEQMIGKLRFKQDLFTGVLDHGEDNIFLNDNKFTKIIEVVGGLVDDEEGNDTKPDTPATALDTKPQNQLEETEEKDTYDTDLYYGEDDGDDEDDFYDYDDFYDWDDLYDDFYENEESDEDEESDESDESDEDDEDDDDDTNIEEHEKAETSQAATESTAEPKEPAATPRSTPTEPGELVAQGVSFLSGLAQTLKSPEATKALVDTIVKTDPDTGKASINIPVPDKESVTQMFTLIAKLFNQ